MSESEAVGPPKPARAQLKDLNGDVDSNGLDSSFTSKVPAKRETLENGKPRFLSSFLVDARGSVLRSTRHLGLHLVIPPGRVCMPTRITCKLVKVEKLSTPPTLKEGESLVSRVLELGPVGTHFIGPVLIELPHVASLHNNEREVIAMRSNDGITWSEQPPATQALVDQINQSAAVPPTGGKSSLSIVSSDFPSYLVAVSRVRQQSRLIGVDGGSLKSDVVPDLTASFPKSSVTKETKVGLQVLPVTTEVIQLVLGKEDGRAIETSPVVTIEPRRRRFHAPISLSIPLPGNVGVDASGLRMLYSISGGANQSKWEDITTSAPMNIVNRVVLFSTTVSARFWLVDCSKSVDSDTVVTAATRVYNEVVAVPIMARFVVYARRHGETEAQLRVLCVTSDTDALTTLESQQGFVQVGQSDYLELTEGKFYCLGVNGNLVPTVASTSQLAIQVHSFRISRLSFVVRLRDQSKIGDCKILVQPAAREGLSVELQEGDAVGVILVSLEQASAVQLDGLHKAGELEKSIDAARQQAANNDADVGVSLKLGDIASALQGDWVLLAGHLGVSEAEIVKIQTDFGSVIEQAMIMLHLWVAKSGHVATDSLERALKQIGRDDVVDRCIHGLVRDSSDPSLANGLTHEDIVPAIDTPCDEPSDINAFKGSAGVSGGVDENPTDVEPSAVYQVEEVWNGSEWHKTTKAIPKQSENYEGDTALEQGVQVSILESQLAVQEKEQSDIKINDDEASRKIDSGAQPSVSVQDVEAVVATLSPVELPQTDGNGSTAEHSSVETPAVSSISLTLEPAEDDSAKLSVHSEAVVPASLEPAKVSSLDDSATESVQHEEAVSLEPTEASTQDDSAKLSVHPEAVVPASLEPAKVSSLDDLATESVQHEEAVSLEPTEASTQDDSAKLSVHPEAVVPATSEPDSVNSANESVQLTEVIPLSLNPAVVSTASDSAEAPVLPEPTDADSDKKCGDNQSPAEPTEGHLVPVTAEPVQSEASSGVSLECPAQVETIVGDSPVVESSGVNTECIANSSNAIEAEVGNNDSTVE